MGRCLQGWPWSDPPRVRGLHRAQGLGQGSAWCPPLCGSSRLPGGDGRRRTPPWRPLTARPLLAGHQRLTGLGHRVRHPGHAGGTWLRAPELGRDTHCSPCSWLLGREASGDSLAQAGPCPAALGSGPARRQKGGLGASRATRRRGCSWPTGLCQEAGRAFVLLGRGRSPLGVGPEGTGGRCSVGHPVAAFSVHCISPLSFPDSS